MTEITTLLIANRGEIARRILRTTRRMSIRTVVVYAEIDRDAPCVQEADVAVPLISATGTEPYLDQSQLLTIARQVGADAIHPGYGFLSERASFAEACEEAGFLWIGPPAHVLQQMSHKLAAKEVARTAGIPTLPDAVVSTDRESGWEQAASQLGYPLLVKTNAGGGGKEIRLVATPSDLFKAIREVSHVASHSLSETIMFLEGALSSPRHIEVQIVADMHGSVLHLYERDCSIQRRYQKVAEAAPPLGLSSRLLQQMRDASLTLATLLGYVGVGTVEYLVEGDRFFFLEMNPRLQMEHPITECLTSLDLVQLQLQIACGGPLPMQQHEIPCAGSALEARLYAEDPLAGFRRTFGRLEQFDLSPHPGIRYETGVASGQMISRYGLLAKVIAHAPTRSEAAHRLAHALREIQVKGLRTNRDFLLAILTHPDFLAGSPPTDFVHTHPELLNQQEQEPE
ncbi:hypothetical protein KSF_086380 [Reticulibacter mediterranei]|uniref:Biotin carboxylase n=1 Tax=Reticulibacter mediterranei TaxID=2778369 RepID=A0A8J3N7L0_9CHLR|nr:biotin carboxylase N-terminal domain-containing protein [Reticulibacter mediterranei]GHO98590.1 hypothetical protein KSF_086380 [Reticulibacter mediterranei]